MIPMTRPTKAQAELIKIVRVHGERAESFRAKSNHYARSRQDAILALSELGLSVRKIGELAGVSSARVQSAIVEARKRRDTHEEATA